MDKVWIWFKAIKFNDAHSVIIMAYKSNKYLEMDERTTEVGKKTRSEKYNGDANSIIRRKIQVSY